MSQNCYIHHSLHFMTKKKKTLFMFLKSHFLHFIKQKVVKFIRIMGHRSLDTYVKNGISKFVVYVGNSH